jgi:D-inositol-3-phosphate glycosyltransferase
MSDAPRVAVLSVHTSPVDQPGIGDSGGMNVYILEVAGRLAAQGVHVDVFARCRGGTDHEVKEVATGARVIPIKAGPCTPLPKADLPRYLPEFLGGVLHEARFHGIPYDVVHSHYWLSGWVGRAVKEVWDAPLVASFHTLGKVKNYSLARDERPESAVRLEGEERVIGAADRILAATPLEAGQLVGLYRADPEHVRLIPPGVDHVLFSPRDRMAARERLHLTHLRFALYVGRLQPHKGPDVAIRTVAEAVARDPETTRDLVLGIVGGPSGSDGEADRLLTLAHDLGVAERVVLFPPQTQRKLSDFYAAADVVLVPSRSESFGLVALEAAACGTPVVAASVGGLRYVVQDGRTGFLVEGHDPGDHADRMLRVLRDGALQASIGAEASRRALRFTWDVTANEVLRVYDEVVRAA